LEQSRKSVPPSKNATAAATQHTEAQNVSDGSPQTSAEFDNDDSPTVISKKKSAGSHRCILKQFGSNLRKLRVSRNITQEQLATKSQISLSAISNYERGIRDITLREVYRLCAALGTDLASIWRDM